MTKCPDQEPDLVTDPALLEVLDDLARHEPLFHRPEQGTTRADFDRLTAPDYWEVGASGQRYSREYIWSILEQRYATTPPQWPEKNSATTDFHLRELAPDTYLLTYTLHQPNRLTRRLTAWQRRRHGWTALYHQGTVVTPPS
ncbi:DUF4440 domain-containing protein [Nocardia sp. NPDC088792]|uniref:nuclear transport factor 2 family protein n=1 Tax=Nocardia sp. NPDC088792 TaxID=3364332 RepID=UPI0038176589